MRIQDYFQESQKRISKNTRVIKDFKVFDFNYIPESPLMREEVKSIVDSLLKYEKTNVPNNLVIYGARALGKTLTIKYLKKVLEDQANLKVLYANCRLHNTSSKILAAFAHNSLRSTRPVKISVILSE